MEITFLKEIAKKLGYDLSVNKESPDTAILSPISNDDKQSHKNIDNDALQVIVETVTNSVKKELDEFRNTFGGESGLAEMMATINQAKLMLEANASQQAASKEVLVDEIVANSGAWTREELLLKPLLELEKIGSMLPRKIDYSFLGAGTPIKNSKKFEPLKAPSVLLAPVGGKE